MSKRDPKLYLEDILISIERIDEYTKDVLFSDFSNDQIVIDAVVRNLEIIGEAARNMPKVILDKHPGIPWEKMVSMRNKVIHEYLNVDLEILWKTIHDDLPPLKKQLKSLPELSKG